VFDNPLREGPDPASRLVGRAQGVGVHASLDESGGLTAIDFLFSDDGHGGYGGSTLATLGHFTVSGGRAPRSAASSAARGSSGSRAGT
jgi:hypothetical protein